MPDLITTAPPDKPTSSEGPRQNVPRLRDGVMKRGQTWSYVIRVKDPETGISKPKWVGGFATEQAAKAARDQARVKAHHGRTSTAAQSP
jgi:Arm domain-containing DNA-binding protein